MAELKQFEDIPSEIADGDTDSVKQTFADYQAQAEEYVRQYPTQSILYGLGAGFILRLLPIGALISALIRLALFALKPALFIYGAVMLYKQYQAPVDNKE